MSDPRLRHFVEQWIAYRDGVGEGPLGMVSWAQVCEAESAARLALGCEASLSPKTEADTRLVRAHEEVTRLRGHVKLLERELDEWQVTAQTTPEAHVFDVTATEAYRLAASHAPRDPGQAYRAGMIYAAYVLSRHQRGLTPSSPA